MRVALLIYGSLNTLSGGYLYDRKLVEYLERQGHSMELISLPWRSYPQHLTDNFSPTLLRRLQNLRADVLLQDELNHPSLFWLNRRLQVNYPIIAIVHHLRSSEARPAWQNTLYCLPERAYLHSVDGFIFNSQTTRNVVEALLLPHLPKEKGPGVRGIVAYPAGDHRPITINEAEIEQRTRQPGPLRLLFVGNLIPRKGLHVLLDALSRLPTDTARLTVVGRDDVDPAYARAIRHQVQRLDLARWVNFLGPLPDAELAECFGNSQALIVPSSYEGFGIVYLEALGFGLPVIATTAGGAGELITLGENGHLIHPGDAAGLAATLSQWQTDRDQLAAFSLAARRQFLTRPGWEAMGQAVEQFLIQQFQI